MEQVASLLLQRKNRYGEVEIPKGIITWLAPFLTLISGYFIVHFLALGRDNRKEFNEAAKAFREAFIPMKQRLQKRGESIVDIMREEFPSQNIAMQKFTPYLAHKKMADLKKQWQKYKEKHDIAININHAADVFYNNGNEIKCVTNEITTISEDILLFARPR